MANEYSDEMNGEEPTEEKQIRETNIENEPAIMSGEQPVERPAEVINEQLLTEEVIEEPLIEEQVVYTNPYIRPGDPSYNQVQTNYVPVNNQFHSQPYNQQSYAEEIRPQYNPYGAQNYAYPVQSQTVAPPKKKMKKVLTGSGIAMFLMLVAMFSFVYVSTNGTSSGVATLSASKASTVLYSTTTNGSTASTSATTSTTGTTATTSNETSAVNTGER